jgi:threonine/homoserine/homoserine lactone efflux protein
MSLRTWAMFVVIETAMSASPGPAVLFVISAALRGGVTSSMWCAVGILAANAMYFTASAVGLMALVLSFQRAFLVVKLGGAAYLTWLGVRTLRSAASMPRFAGSNEHHPLRLSIEGFVLQASNPKAMLFFAAFLPQFIEPSRSVPTQLGILGGTSLFIEFLILTVYGAGAGITTRIMAGGVRERCALVRRCPVTDYGRLDRMARVR